MAKKFFPFTDTDVDPRVYGSADFRSFFRSLVGDGRCAYAEFNIPVENSLKCSIDDIDQKKIKVTAGACITKGGIYQNDASETLSFTLPTGGTTFTGYVIARINPIEEKNIELFVISVSNYNDDTDLILANVSAVQDRITEVINVNNIAGRIDVIEGINEVRVVSTEPTDEVSKANPRILYIWGE